MAPAWARYRWVVEQSIALLHWFRRLRIRWEIRDDIHEAFLSARLLPSSAGDDCAASHFVRTSKSARRLVTPSL